LSLQSVSSGFPLEERDASRAAASMSPPKLPPLIALGSTPESPDLRSCTVLVGCSRLEFRGLRETSTLSPRSLDRSPRSLPKVRALLSCRWPRVQSLTLARLPDRDPVAEAPVSFSCGPSSRFSALRRLRMWTATHTGLASSGCAAPSGFLGLLTPCSVHLRSGLVSCR
jgi:hypothetical protein